MILELEKKVQENTLLVDELISKYFFKSLGKNDKQTITSLIANGKFSFSQKIKLFCELVTMSNIDRAKFKVYAKINNDLSNNDILKPTYFQNIKNYHAFLINTYSTPTDKNSFPEKLFSATNRLSNNIVRITQIYCEKPQVYSQRKTKNLFSS